MPKVSLRLVDGLRLIMGKFAIHLTRKRLIEANSRPFAVENVGFYARAGEWQDKGAKSPSAKLYRNAMVEVYGGAPVEGFTYLHGRKGTRWVHVGPLNAPVVEAQLECIGEGGGGDGCSVGGCAVGGYRYRL